MKFKLTDVTLDFYGKKLYRIQALKDFSDVKKGDLGGWIAKESNLSQEGDCWIYNDAKVYDDAKVSGNARVCDEARVSDYTQVYGDACVLTDAQVLNGAEVFGNPVISTNAWIECTNDYGVFQGFGCSKKSVTFFRSKYGKIFVNEDNFNGSLIAFKDMTKKFIRKDSRFAKEYRLMIKLAKLRLKKIKIMITKNFAEATTQEYIESTKDMKKYIGKRCRFWNENNLVSSLGIENF